MEFDLLHIVGTLAVGAGLVAAGAWLSREYWVSKGSENTLDYLIDNNFIKHEINEDGEIVLISRDEDSLS